MQAKFLRPNDAMVDQLATLLATKKIGIVAHFYMDPEVQVRHTGRYMQCMHLFYPHAQEKQS